MACHEEFWSRKNEFFYAEPVRGAEELDRLGVLEAHGALVLDTFENVQGG